MRLCWKLNVYCKFGINKVTLVKTSRRCVLCNRNFLYTKHKQIVHETQSPLTFLYLSMKFSMWSSIPYVPFYYILLYIFTHVLMLADLSIIIVSFSYDTIPSICCQMPYSAAYYWCYRGYASLLYYVMLPQHQHHLLEAMVQLVC